MLLYKHAKLVESEYGLPGPLSFERVHDGGDNEVLIVTDKHGTKYALRQSKRVGKNIAFEVELLATLASHDFCSPKPLQTKSNEYVVEVNGTQLVLFNYIQGKQFEKVLPEHLKDATVEQGAKKLGELHKLTNGLQLKTEPTRNIFTEYDRFFKLTTKQTEQFDGYKEFADNAKKFYDEAKAKIKNKIGLYGIIHNDYRIQNLIYTKGNCYIIDFDWSCYGPILKDVGLAIAEWSMYTKESGAAQEAIDYFIAAYNKTAPQKISYDEELIFWICFACLSDACTFFTDTAEGTSVYPGKITNVDQCHMYRKFKYFNNQIR